MYGRYQEPEESIYNLIPKTPEKPPKSERNSLNAEWKLSNWIHCCDQTFSWVPSHLLTLVLIFCKPITIVNNQVVSIKVCEINQKIIDARLRRILDSALEIFFFLIFVHTIIPYVWQQMPIWYVYTIIQAFFTL